MALRGYPSLDGADEPRVYAASLVFLTAAAWAAALRATHTGVFKRPTAWLLGGFAAGLGLEAAASFAVAAALGAPPPAYSGVTFLLPLSVMVAFRSLHGRLWPTGRAAAATMFAALSGGLAVNALYECCRRAPGWFA